MDMIVVTAPTEWSMYAHMIELWIYMYVIQIIAQLLSILKPNNVFYFQNCTVYVVQFNSLCQIEKLYLKYPCTINTHKNDVPCKLT